MPIRAKIYAWFIVAAGAVTVASAAAQWKTEQMDRFLICLVLALLASTFKVKLPGSTTAISPSVAPILLAAGTLGWPGAVLIAAASGVVQSIWRPGRRPAAIQILFNGANLALAAAIAYAVSHFAAGGKTTAGIFLVAAIVYELVNVSIVSTVLCLLEDRPLMGIFRATHLWSFPYHLGGAALAAVWAQYGSASAVWQACLLCAGMLYLMSVFYDELVRRLATAGPQKAA